MSLFAWFLCVVIVVQQFLSCISTLMRDIDIAILSVCSSVCNVPVSDTAIVTIEGE